jgi:eukaryotic-like serine/threonine-protein kinase
LRKHGIKVRLHEQPFRILMMLLERRGELVPREEIRRVLWPNNTVVEFDHSINAAIQRLRVALGDSSDNPRYVETLARRGYRFIGEVAAPASQLPESVVDEDAAAVRRPAVPVPPRDPGDLSGETFSHFRVIEKLGSGGMGVVYRAEDLTLGRQVALKFLPFSGEEATPQMLERFQREARAASALNYPNICTVYGVDEFAGQPVIVMELLEGETLEARLAKGALDREKAMPLVIQLVKAMDAAHRKGIVHRDLKPANVMLTKSGVKVLDFGLAKMPRAQIANEETAREISQPGAILGTWQYMSPEQVQGKEADARSDIFSFGCILFEMLTCRRAFAGDSPAHLAAAILTEDPLAGTSVATSVPVALANIIRHCLEKTPEERFQSTRDLLFVLESIAGASAGLSAPAIAPGAARHMKIAWSVAGVAIAVLAFTVWLQLGKSPPSYAAPVRFPIPTQPNAYAPALSPDGRKLTFIRGNRLWVHFLESDEFRDLASTNTGGLPFWSADSRFIGYPDEGKLKKIAAAGGSPQTIIDFPGNWAGGTWNQNDVIVFGDQRIGMFRVSASGGAPVQITSMNSAQRETIHFGPFFLPDGKHFIYTRASMDRTRSAVYVGSVDATPGRDDSKFLLNSTWEAMYTPSAGAGAGYLLFVREDTLMAQPFDDRRLQLKGQALPVADEIRDNSGSGTGGWAHFSVSVNDVLVYRRRGVILPLNWCDRQGKVMAHAADLNGNAYLALSPDGKRLAMTKGVEPDPIQIWLLDLTRGGASARFAFGFASNTSPVWSPDGSHLIFSSNRVGPYDLYRRALSGEKSEEVVLKSSQDKYASSWSPDGRHLLYTVVDAKTKNDLWILPLEGERKPTPFLITQFDERQAQFSPDGRWVAYTSNESGQDEVYVRQFSPRSGTAGEEGDSRLPISNDWGQDPRWRGDGRELFYRSRDGMIMAVEIATRPEFRAGKPQPLGVSTNVFGNVNFAFGSMWDCSADGNRFLARGPAVDQQPYTVVLNWQAALKR